VDTFSVALKLVGIAAETKDKLFQTFFTTKRAGEGTVMFCDLVGSTALSTRLDRLSRAHEDDAERAVGARLVH
jgi:class 3 adenylate cyclase